MRGSCVVFFFVVIAAAPMRAAADDGVWSERALGVHARAARMHARFVWARHDLARLPSQRACFELLASRAGALVRMLEDRAVLGPMRERALDDTAFQLDSLALHAEEVCTRTRVVEGEVDVDRWRDPFEQRMPRDRAILRIGGRFELVPRVRRGGYGPTQSWALRGALGGFVLPWLRVEAIASLGWLPPYGPHGSAGARALITAPWSLFRVAGGIAASVLVASDRLGNIEFGWVGVQIELPLEIAFEITESFGLTLTGGPMYTQAGEVRAAPQAISGSLGLLAELVL